MDVARKSGFMRMVNSAFGIFLSRDASEREMSLWLQHFASGGVAADLIGDLRAQVLRLQVDPSQPIGAASFSGLIPPCNSPAALCGRPLPDDGPPKLMLRDNRIAILSTYPPSPPRHGGQHRLLNIGLAYKNAGFQVQHCGVMGGTGFPDDPHFDPYPGERVIDDMTGRNSRLNEWAVGRLYSTEPAFQESLFRKIGDPPALIHVEQPWLFGFAKHWADRSTSSRSKIIYGSQNIEHSLTYDIVRKAVGEKIGRDCQRKVEVTEIEAISKCDLLLGVTRQDCDWMLANGGRNAIVVPNGVSRRELTAKGLASANEISGGGKFALVCASAHPPNIESIFEIFGDGLACFSPREKLVLAGSVGWAVRADPRYTGNASLQRFVVMPGLVDEECLKGLLDTAHAILLPITSGEGSNLKTAEAILARKHIVATKTAFRGFERFASLDGIHIAKDGPSLLHLTRNALSSPPFVAASQNIALRESLEWSSVLQSLTGCLEVASGESGVA